jgi:enamine deaminase RidA (YjgF/YER057c/UK114 family)
MVSAIENTGTLALLTWTAGSGLISTSEQAAEAYRALEAALREAGASILQERVFGSLDAAPLVMTGRARATVDRSDAWAVPPTFVEGTPVSGAGFAGIHVLAVRRTGSRLVMHGDQVLGRVVKAPGARLFGIADAGRYAGTDASRGPSDEATVAIDAAGQLLENQGFTFRDVVRTWYYLRDILAWYGPFNAARNAAFRQMGLIGPTGDGAIPASTGIGGRGARGAWCTLDLIAAQATGEEPFGMERLHNRRQNEATEYGSAFARGMALTLGSHRYLFISGTASIDDHGATVHAGDFEAQTRHTIEAIGALLEGAGASLADIGQATAFLKDPGDVRRFERIAERAGLDRIPPILVAADACRENLLVEIDATAVVPVRDTGAGR